MTKTLETSTETKILVRARELIEQGWTQGATHRRELRRPRWWRARQWVDVYCASGALEAAANGAEEGQRALRRLHDVVHERVTCWNDRRGRKQKEVLAAFDEAIARSVAVVKLP